MRARVEVLHIREISKGKLLSCSTKVFRSSKGNIYFEEVAVDGSATVLIPKTSLGTALAGTDTP